MKPIRVLNSNNDELLSLDQDGKLSTKSGLIEVTHQSNIYNISKIVIDSKLNVNQIDDKLIIKIPEGINNIPIGGIILYLGDINELSNDWLECNGSEFDVSIYPKLHEILNDNTTPLIPNQLYKSIIKGK